MFYLESLFLLLKATLFSKNFLPILRKEMVACFHLFLFNCTLNAAQVTDTILEGLISNPH